MSGRVFHPGYPVNLRLTLGGVKGLRFGDDSSLPAGAWWATRTPEGPATLHLAADRGSIQAAAWGEGSQWALAQVPGLLGDCDEPGEFAPDHPVLQRLQKELRGLRLGRTDRVFEALTPTILEQKVTGKEAARSYRRLVKRYGHQAPGPYELMVPPSPETLRRLPYYDLHPLGVERRRATTLQEAASRASRLEEVSALGRDEGYRRLQAVPGVGPWTAAKVMAAATGDPDAVPVGDYHLPNIVAWALAGEPRADDERMLELLESYRGQRGRVIRMLKMAGVSAPAYGPRVPLREFERA